MARTTTSRVTQDEARYQAEPRGGQRCETCRHFIADQSACEIVAGRISPRGWSRYFTPG